MFKALGDETRLRIIALLAHGDLCVCHVESALGLTQSNASRQLGVLKHAGVVEHRREGSWVYYGLAEQADETTRRLMRELIRTFAAEDVLRRDLDRLTKVKGPASCK
jgi:ArsR family transcriptional regulator, arsenate/arsenite/antimonite-responsive transcriptional repressor